MREPTCRSCIHFADDPAYIEAEIPKFTVFGSAYSSARGHGGFCLIFDRFLDPLPASYCPEYALSAISNDGVRSWNKKKDATP